MAKIELSMPYLLENEGGFTSGDGTNGFNGWTNYGITAPDLAEYLGAKLTTITEDMIKTLAQSTAGNIYKEQYWDKMRLDEVTDQGIATCIFDCGVNMGIYIGSLFAQKTCEALGHPLVFDGQIGGHTIAALNQCERLKFIKTYEALVWARYTTIVENNPEDKVYLKGWLSRAQRLLSLIG